MGRRRRIVLVSALVAAATLLPAGAAYALWAMNDAVTPPALGSGAVSFGAWGGADSQAARFTTDGSAVSVTLPASEVVKVLNQLGPDPEPVIWSFTVAGFAHGITGLDFDVTVDSQVWSDQEAAAINSGQAAKGTVLALSTLKVYPAAVNGDCSVVPNTPAGESDRNVHLYDGEGQVLQAAGAFRGELVEQVWCAALNFNADPDGAYANEVQAIGTGGSGDLHAAVDRWRASIGFPPSLEVLGPYRNRADVVGKAVDGTLSRDNDGFEAPVYPDPSSEPDVLIRIDPAVTNLNPAVQTGDHFAWST